VTITAKAVGLRVRTLLFVLLYFFFLVTIVLVVNIHVDELSSARMWQHELCATLPANVNINYRLPIKVYYRICTLRHQNRNNSWKPDGLADISKYVYLRREGQSNAPVHVLMRLYPIDKSFCCLQSERRTSC
jgi:hypothetical protein